MARLDHERNNTRIRGVQAANEAERAPIDDAQQGKRRRSPPHQPRRQGGRR